MSLRNWLRNGWLVEHHPTKQEIADLLAIVERDLKTAEIEGQDRYWQFAMAYNAALKLPPPHLPQMGTEQIATPIIIESLKALH